MNVLFVDDYYETRGLFRLFFNLKGHQIYTAESGAEALEMIEQCDQKLDVIIIDYHMPNMNGLEVVEQLRQKEEVPPIIVFTNDNREALQSRARELGVARVIHKPIMPLDLIDVAQEVVDSARSE